MNTKFIITPIGKVIKMDPILYNGWTYHHLYEFLNNEELDLSKAFPYLHSKNPCLSTINKHELKKLVFKEYGLFLATIKILNSGPWIRIVHGNEYLYFSMAEYTKEIHLRVHKFIKKSEYYSEKLFIELYKEMDSYANLSMDINQFSVLPYDIISSKLSSISV